MTSAPGSFTVLLFFPIPSPPYDAHSWALIQNDNPFTM